MLSPALLALTLSLDPTGASPCTQLPLYDAGHPVGMDCAEALPPDVVALDLRDDWAPTIFSETTQRPQPYRAVFVTLANQHRGDRREGVGVRRDGGYELFGIPPSLSVVRARLLDEERHHCHALVDDVALALTTSRGWPPAAEPLESIRRHLACDGLLPPHARATAASILPALATYQGQHMIPSPPGLDADTRAALLTGSRELDFRALLRVLRERVVDATGLIEDGSAANAWEPVLGRDIDAAAYRAVLRSTALPHAAPDLIARATNAAAVALGWTSPEAAASALVHAPPARVAVRLPTAPPYHDPRMSLRAEIDRGDVWMDPPIDDQGRPRASPVRWRPTLVVYAATASGEIPLVRWPTTIGGFKEEKLADGRVELRYKASPVGRRYWRDLFAAPAWFPPPSTPDGELVRRKPDGGWTVDAEAVGPGYRSAYGLLALLHHRAAEVAGGGEIFTDIQVRTHGSGNYLSIRRGTSHGCHRLFNHLAIRLGGFLLSHRENVRHGAVHDRYRRIVRWKGEARVLRADTRGYRYELIPPVPVDVLPGRPVHGPRPARSTGLAEFVPE